MSVSAEAIEQLALAHLGSEEDFTEALELARQSLAERLQQGLPADGLKLIQDNWVQIMRREDKVGL